jgi:hypothetical protein
VKTSEKLLQRLRSELELDIPEGARLERSAGSYRGDNRTQGAWVWHVVCEDGIPLRQDSEGRPLAIGSQWTMSELVNVPLAAHPDLYGDIVIDPASEVYEAMRHG